jgi:hypothetical protein
MARSRPLTLASIAIPLFLAGTVSCNSRRPESPPLLPGRAGSPAEVVGGSIHVCSTAPIIQTSDPYSVAVDDNSKVTLYHVEFPHGQSAPTFTHTWTMVISNRHHDKSDKDGAITLTSSGATQVNIHLREYSMWLPPPDPKKLKFHDKDDGKCSAAAEDLLCDHLSHITFMTTAANGTTTTTKGLCKTGLDGYGDPDGKCAIVIGTASAPMACD